MKFRNTMAGRGYELEDDVYDGFNTSVQRNQTSLALQYALVIVADLKERIEAVEAELAKKPVAKSTPSTAKEAKTTNAESDTAL